MYSDEISRLKEILARRVKPTSGLVIFFFYQYGAHRDLYSFPTRRSSDLRSIRDGGMGAAAGLFVPDRGARTIRSEEHTSELQSRGQIVCRLLLEKKTALKALIKDMNLKTIDLRARKKALPD